MSRQGAGIRAAHRHVRISCQVACARSSDPSIVLRPSRSLFSVNANFRPIFTLQTGSHQYKSLATLLIMTDSPREIKEKILALGIGSSDLVGCKSKI